MKLRDMGLSWQQLTTDDHQSVVLAGRMYSAMFVTVVNRAIFGTILRGGKPSQLSQSWLGYITTRN
jgi:hypothetical protein